MSTKAEMVSCLNAALRDAQHELDMAMVDRSRSIEALDAQLERLDREVRGIQLAIARYELLVVGT